MRYAQVAFIKVWSMDSPVPQGPTAPNGQYKAGKAIDDILAEVETTAREELGGASTNYAEADLEEARGAAVAWLVGHAEGTPLAVEFWVADVPAGDATRVYYGPHPAAQAAAEAVASKLHDLGPTWPIDTAFDATLPNGACYIRVGLANLQGPEGRTRLNNPSWQALIGAQIADGVLAYTAVPEE